MRKKNGVRYAKIIYDVIKQAFEESPHDVLLSRPQITKLVCEKKSDDEGLIGSARYTPKQVQPSVYRNLLALVKAKKILLIEDKYYVPNIGIAIRRSLRSRLERLPFNEDGIFFVSPSTILLSIRRLSDVLQDEAPVERASTTVLSNDELGELFREYLTEKNCFNVHITESYVVLLIKGTDDELAAIGKELTDIVRRSWERQNQPKMNFRKRKRPMKNTEQENMSEE